MNAFTNIHALDYSPSLTEAVDRLTDEFAGALGRETVERMVASSYDELATGARIATFLPLMAERFARERLRALARVEGHHADGLPTVLFVCVHNAARSQMALGFLQAMAGDQAVGWSGGSEPGHVVNPEAVRAMSERGIDIALEFPKPWTDEIVRAADVVVTMGCGDECPYVPGTRYVDWELTDPAGQGVDTVREIAADIEQRVRDLLVELGLDPKPLPEPLA